MPVTTPKIILRIGSYAEKEYFEKLARKLDAVMFGGNLLEIAPTATASFLALLKRKRDGDPVPYFLDPITFCFGAYIDPETGLKREDLQALKSERTNRKTKERFTAIKDSYVALAHQLGDRFATAVNDGDTCTAVNPAAIPASDRNAFCQGVLDYQANRIAQIIDDEVPEGDIIMRDAFGEIGAPAALFAPYFYVHEDWSAEGLDAAIDLVRRSAALSAGLPVHAVLCLNRPLLTDSDSIDFISAKLPETKAGGVWLWFDGLDEGDKDLSVEEAMNLRMLVKHLSGFMDVYNLHGGYFSLLLAHDGLAGISHGVGYGERKFVAQVQGVAAPTVRYYLPAIRKRAGVPDIQRCFRDARVDVKNASEFLKKVCDCAICKGVIGDNVRHFAKFGEMHRAKAESKRDTQTPRAAKICRYHFLLRRLAEKDAVAAMSAGERAAHIRNVALPWRDQYTMEKYVGEPDNDGYLESWSHAFGVDI